MDHSKQSGSKTLLWLTVATYIFLFVPVLVVILMSFHPHPVTSFPIPGFSLRWYKEFLADTPLIQSLVNSVLVGLCSSLLAGAVGTLSALGFVRSRFKGKQLFGAVILSPMILSPIITGIALLSFISFIGVYKSFTILVMGHTLLTFPYVFLVVQTQLYGFDRSIEEASLNLGANEIETFFYITLPNILPSIIAGMLFAFTISIDEFVATQCWVTPSTETVPIKIYSMLKYEVTPKVNVLGTIIIAVTIMIPFVAEKVAARKMGVTLAREQKAKSGRSK
ncbi:MAG: ABC transporter permease [Deltaproteobacteria bacterium]|nr:ABC transporter permease [Deltaproteobacteria bacterium]